jgi:hypothetical protein
LLQENKQLGNAMPAVCIRREKQHGVDAVKHFFTFSMGGELAARRISKD